MPSLEDAINAAGGPLALLRGGSGGFPMPIKSEFTNWRDEQESWRTTAALMDGKHEVTALNHRMSGFPGLEFFGPYEDFENVRDTLLAAGAEYGMRQVGARAYASVATESGWVANTVPAIYTGAKMKAYRDWLPQRGFEANLALAGSYVPERTEDLYVTPWDLGYGKSVTSPSGPSPRGEVASPPRARHARRACGRDEVTRLRSG